MNHSQWKMKSKVGDLYLVASEKGLSGVYWEKQNYPIEKSSTLLQAAREIDEYLNNKRKNFNVKLDMVGTPFQIRVWKQLLKVSYGATCSYQDIAKKIKNPKSARAVGSANGKNPLCIIVPCHRVISADGSLGGYSAGIDKKIKLLNLEIK